jgi:hypothetical protein
MSTEWITDRLPTAEDADDFFYVWITHTNGDVRVCNWRFVKPQMPWLPTNKPAPYRKPKKWTVEWDTEWDTWSINDNHRKVQFSFVLRGLKIDQGDVAQRIEDLFNEVMP